MKTVVSISFGLLRDWNSGANKLPRDILDNLKRSWRGDVKEESVQVEGDPSSEAIRHAIRLAIDAGKTPKLCRMPTLDINYRGPLFNLTGKRQFDRSDFESNDYFAFYPEDKLAEQNHFKYPDGTREKAVDGKSISKRRAFGFAGPYNWACKAETRAELEAEGFAGLAFEEMPQKPPSKPYVPVCRLVSSITLPPVLNPLYNEDGEPCQGDFSRGCIADNSIIDGLPYYYDEAAIRAMEPLDCAWTREAFGGAAWRNRAFIVSKRFLEYCWSRKWKCSWVPAILRPDGKAPEPEPLFPWLELT